MYLKLIIDSFTIISGCLWFNFKYMYLFHYFCTVVEINEL